MKMEGAKGKHDDHAPEVSGKAGPPPSPLQGPTRIVAFAGLPGTGKSSLARRLAQRCAAPLLDKDRVREALFGPRHVAYTKEQDDFCCELLYRAIHHLRDAGTPLVILDGRTYTRREDARTLSAALDRPQLRLSVIECTAPEAVVRARLDADRGIHPAANRSPELYARLRDAAEPLELPRLTLDTGNASLEALEARCVAYLGLD